MKSWQEVQLQKNGEHVNSTLFGSLNLSQEVTYHDHFTDKESLPLWSSFRWQKIYLLIKANAEIAYSRIESVHARTRLSYLSPKKLLNKGCGNWACVVQHGLYPTSTIEIYNFSNAPVVPDVDLINQWLNLGIMIEERALQSYNLTDISKDCVDI